MPRAFQNYHEPFLGGGAMYFAAQHRASGQAYLSDLNEELVNTWVVIRDATDELLEALQPYADQDSEEFYYQVRVSQPQEALTRAARFIYLNQTAWNSLWRVNRWGEFNVPWGDRRFRGFVPQELHEVSRVLQAASIEALDFRDALSKARPGDFVYLDPPYLPVSDTSKFSGYTERRFRQPDLRELADCCEQLTKLGVYWLLSNRDTPLVRELFGHATIIGLTTRRSVAAQNRRDIQPVDSPEVIVVGRPSRWHHSL